MVSEKCQEVFTEVYETFIYELPKTEVTKEVDKLIQLMDTDKDAMKKIKEIQSKSDKAYEKMEKSIDKLVKCECGK